ncbi:hypothetical protein MYX82_03425 [Acidobacteria bacterium AH-259-D05]|nr:hypothetical protein [Acidobacteria bacterium AH-259-D05]
MKGDQLPESDHVSRYCGGSHVQDDEVDGSAFMLREKEEYLSVNWLECLHNSDRNRQIHDLRRVLEGKGFSLGKTAIIAVLNVDEVIDHVQQTVNRTIDVLHEPEPEDPSHSGVFGYTVEDHLIADLIAETVNEKHPARER